MWLGRSGRWWSFQRFCTPIPIRARMSLELLPGTNRPRDRPTHSPINSWPMPSLHDFELLAGIGFPARRSHGPGLRWLNLLPPHCGRLEAEHSLHSRSPFRRAIGGCFALPQAGPTEDVQNRVRIGDARCSLRPAVTRSAITFLRVLPVPCHVGNFPGLR